MKFDCGLSKEEKECRKYSWHRWFAWYPVRTDHRECRWLEFVERKLTMYNDYSGEYYSVYNYRSVRK